MSLSDITIRRPVFAWMVMGALMIFGLISFNRLGVSQLPNIDFPTVNVSLTWEGAAPEVMETDVVNEVEQALMTVQGVKEITSTVSQGTGRVTVELELGRDVDVAVQEIQSKLNETQRKLPKDIDPPSIRKSNPSSHPIMFIGVSSDRPRRQLMEYVERYMRDKFTTVQGVGEVMLGGYVDPNLRVWVDNKKLNTYELTIDDVTAAIGEGHSELPAGRIETDRSEQSVRVMGEAKTPEDFGNILITKRGGKPIYVPIYLKDVATIEDGLDDVRRISRVNGLQAVGIGIQKQSGANEVAVARAVKARLDEIMGIPPKSTFLQKTFGSIGRSIGRIRGLKEAPEAVSRNQLPPDVSAQIVFDGTKFIEDSIHELTFTLILSALVTSLVCWFFLGAWSATLNILLAIPTSILGTFIVVYFLGFTLNTFTVLGLSLAVGIVVDDSIMVLENIVRFREHGEDKSSAARKGANQISGAAFATTMAMTAIFIPVIFIAGIMGKFFFEFGVTIAVAVWLSLMEALMLTPMRCSQFLQVGHGTKFGQGVDKGFKKIAAAYGTALQWALRHPWMVIILSLAVFFGSLVIGAILPKEFVPAQDQSMLMCSLETPPGSAITFTDDRVRLAEKFLSTRPEVLRYFVAVGGFSGSSVSSANMFVTFKPLKERPVDPVTGRRPSQSELMNIFRKELNKIPDLKTRVQDPSLSGFSSGHGNPIEFSIRGPDWDKLIEYDAILEDRMEKSGYMVDVDSDYKPGASEIQVVPDRKKAEDFGVSMDTISQAVNAMIGGARVAKYSSGDRRYDVRVRLVADQRGQSADINNIWVLNNRGERVLLKDLVTITERQTSQSITRKGRERAISLFSNVAPGKSQAEAIAVAEKIAKETLPEGYRAILGGSAQTMKESTGDVGMVFFLGILVAYMVLGSQYNSFLQPFIVLLALPFSISGAFGALWIGKQSINLYSMIGLILLMGIVKKNSILLVDFTNQVRAEGKKVEEALLIACPIRLRPILMTSLATIAAAIPPAMAIGAGAEVRAPMAIAVIGGVAVSTFFTLFVVPCVYRLTVRDWNKRATV